MSTAAAFSPRSRCARRRTESRRCKSEMKHTRKRTTCTKFGKSFQINTRLHQSNSHLDANDGATETVSIELLHSESATVLPIMQLLLHRRCPIYVALGLNKSRSNETMKFMSKMLPTRDLDKLDNGTRSLPVSKLAADASTVSPRAPW